jgi:hypothetical protein
MSDAMRSATTQNSCDQCRGVLDNARIIAGEMKQFCSFTCYDCWIAEDAASSTQQADDVIGFSENR